MAARLHLTFDLADRPDLVEDLRLLAGRKGTTQKAIVVDALQAYFAQNEENSRLLDTANRVFAEWQNEEDKVYDAL